jgi:hypothetical protein
MQLEIGGAPLGPVNPLPITCTNGGATIACAATFGSAMPPYGDAIGVDNASTFRALNGDSSGNAGVDLYEINGANIITGGVGGSLAIGGTAAAGAAITGNPLRSGGAAVAAEPTLATAGNATDRELDLAGRTVVDPYALHESQVTGTGNGTGTTAISLSNFTATAGIKYYVTDIEIARTDTGAAPIVVTLNDTASTPIIVPNAGNGGVVEKTFATPLHWAANTAVTCTSGTAVTTLYCSAQGFKSAE